MSYVYVTSPTTVNGSIDTVDWIGHLLKFMNEIYCGLCRTKKASKESIAIVSSSRNRGLLQIQIETAMQ